MVGVGGLPRPGRELAEKALEVAIDQAGKHVAEVGGRIDAVQLAALDQRATTAQFSAPSSEPANRAFLRFSAIAQLFCPYRAGGRGKVSLARSLWSPRPVPAVRAARSRADCSPRDGARGGHCGLGVDPGSGRLHWNGARRTAGGGIGAG